MPAPSRCQRIMAVTGLALTVTGCGSMSGLDARAAFACQAPDGVLCESMSGIYANAQQHNLPGQRVHQTAKIPPIPTAPDAPAALTAALDSGTPMRTAPRILRLWFAPWEDSDGDLHDQSYVYLSVDAGQWRIAHERQRIAEHIRPMRTPTPPLPIAESSATRPMTAAPVATTESVGLRQARPDSDTANALLRGIATPTSSTPSQSPTPGD